MEVAKQFHIFYSLNFIIGQSKIYKDERGPWPHLSPQPHFSYKKTSTNLSFRTASPHVLHENDLVVDGALFIRQLLRMFAVVVVALVEDVALVLVGILKRKQLQESLTTTNPTPLVVTGLKKLIFLFMCYFNVKLLKA